MVFLGVYFSTYEHLKHYIMQGQLVHPSVAVPISGGIAGSVGWFVSFPLDCIKAHIQGMPLHVKQLQPSAFSVFKELLRTRGFVGLYAGVLPSIIRAFIVSSSRFSAYEGTMWCIEKSCG